MDISEEYIIDELGLRSAPENVRQAALALVYDTFNKRAFMTLADKLTDEQRQEFDSMSNKSDDELMTWVEANIPNSKDVIASEMKLLLEDIKKVFPKKQ